MNLSLELSRVSLTYILYVLKLCNFLIIRAHRSTTYVDAAYCYRPSSAVCRSVCHTSEPYKNS